MLRNADWLIDIKGERYVVIATVLDLDAERRQRSSNARVVCGTIGTENEVDRAVRQHPRSWPIPRKGTDDAA